jgi:hypothetical protein
MERDRDTGPKAKADQPGEHAPAVGKQTQGDTGAKAKADEPAEHAPAIGKQTQADNLEGGKGEQGPGNPGKGAKGSAGAITATTDSGAFTGGIANISVGTKVKFSAKEEGRWRIDQQDLGQGQSVDYEAPETATMGNVVFEPYEDSKNKGTQASMPVLIVAPTGVEFKKLGDVPSAGPGLAGVGMTAEVTLGPKLVKFDQVEWLEKPSGPEGVSGYFAEYVSQTGRSLDHKPNAAWMKATELRDSIFSADKPKLTHPTEKTKRWWAGQYSWTIPNAYRVVGKGEHQFTTVTQTFTMADDGTMTVTKGGASATAKPGGDTQGDLQKFASVAEARGFLLSRPRGDWMNWVMNYKRNPKADPASVGNLLSALREAGLVLKVRVHANKTYSWTDADLVTIKSGKTASKTGPRKVNNDGKDVTFDLDADSVFDFSKMTGTESIPIEATIEDHNVSTTISYPFAVQDQALGEKHTISTHLE